MKRTWVGRHDAERSSRGEEGARSHGSEGEASPCVDEGLLQVIPLNGGEAVASLTIDQSIEEHGCTSDSSLKRMSATSGAMVLL